MGRRGTVLCPIYHSTVCIYSLDNLAWRMSTVLTHSENKREKRSLDRRNMFFTALRQYDDILCRAV